eukprot:2497559-Rhodomonas_salina.1
MNIRCVVACEFLRVSALQYAPTKCALFWWGSQRLVQKFGWSTFYPKTGATTSALLFCVLQPARSDCP